MATRIAGYYQQRSQAWAAAHRKQCQAAMQAATVVVAWYVRDRLARRRKRKRRKFARALEAREREKERERERERRRVAAGGVGAAGGCAAWESVRRWVCRLPPPSLAPSLPLVGVGIPGGPFASAAVAAAAVAANGSGADAARDMPWDRDEANFDMDRARARDKDAQLYDVADNIIKNHLTRTDVPLLGALSFDESESESEEEESEDGSMDYDEEDAEGEDDEYEGNGCQAAAPQGGMASGSKDAQLGTPNGGR
ncbi:uncharacterized protein C8A04DRAFT_26758 [Dichotomopilus funicola]|uniref:Uncharacterized protein n=1 Tax=Dichotomopilus funicola TaxID=1934379 RepID=A0AAN6V8I0_9PEZI|nr:hypothetical protein C8A04DRAFT_26758 [Dichotomopilus funicola]